MRCIVGMGQEKAMENLMFGAAYYPEYMPYDRLEKDITMMKKAGMNTLRIAESTWSSLEPEDGIFDFSYIDRVLEAARRENSIEGLGCENSGGM